MTATTIIRTILATSLILPALVLANPAATANVKPSNTAPAKDQILEQVFDDIMVNLPSEVKAHLDTAGARAGSRVKRAEKKQPDTPPTIDARRSDGLAELPEDLRRQVEKQIKEIELRRKERELQFKEIQTGNKNRKQGDQEQ